MGIMDSLKSLTGGGGDSSEDIADDFEDEFEEGDEWDDEFEEGGGEVLEWETGYQFAEDMLQEEGFSGMKEFIDHAMMMKIKQSPMYRNRIESGLNAMNMITGSFKDVSELQGQFGSDRSYQEFADDIQAANNIINELDKMAGEEERMVNEIVGTAQMLAQGLIDQSKKGKSSPSSVEVTDEEI